MIHCCFCFVCARNYTELHCLRLCGSSAVMCLAIFLKLFCRGIYFFLPSSQELTVHFCPAVVDFNPYKKYINWEDKHWTVTACSCSGTIAVHLTWGLLERGTFASQACAVQSWLDQFRKKNNTRAPHEFRFFLFWTWNLLSVLNSLAKQAILHL